MNYSDDDLAGDLRRELHGGLVPFDPPLAQHMIREAIAASPGRRLQHSRWTLPVLASGAVAVVVGGVASAAALHPGNNPVHPGSGPTATVPASRMPTPTVPASRMPTPTVPGFPIPSMTAPGFPAPSTTAPGFPMPSMTAPTLPPSISSSPGGQSSSAPPTNPTVPSSATTPSQPFPRTSVPGRG